MVKELIAKVIAYKTEKTRRKKAERKRKQRHRASLRRFASAPSGTVFTHLPHSATVLYGTSDGMLHQSLPALLDADRIWADELRKWRSIVEAGWELDCTDEALDADRRWAEELNGWKFNVVASWGLECPRQTTDNEAQTPRRPQRKPSAAAKPARPQQTQRKQPIEDVKRERRLRRWEEPVSRGKWTATGRLSCRSGGRMWRQGVDWSIRHRRRYHRGWGC